MFPLEAVKAVGGNSSEVHVVHRALDLGQTVCLQKLSLVTEPFPQQLQLPEMFLQLENCRWGKLKVDVTAPAGPARPPVKKNSKNYYLFLSLVA